MNFSLFAYILHFIHFSHIRCLFKNYLKKHNLKLRLVRHVEYTQEFHLRKWTRRPFTTAYFVQHARKAILGRDLQKEWYRNLTSTFGQPLGELQWLNHDPHLDYNRVRYTEEGLLITDKGVNPYPRVYYSHKGRFPPRLKK